ncbi:hypothetical protein PR048_001480, partial [Dryococelus australis]
MAFQMNFGRMVALNTPLMNSKISDGSGISDTAFPVPTFPPNTMYKKLRVSFVNVAWITDTMLALLHHRNTPREKLGSPSQRIMGRRTRTLLLTSEKLLQPAL